MFALAFGIAFAVSAWLNLGPMPDGSRAVSGLTVLIALWLAYRAGARSTVSTATAVAVARSEASSTAQVAVNLFQASGDRTLPVGDSPAERLAAAAGHELHAVPVIDEAIVEDAGLVEAEDVGYEELRDR